MVVMRTYTITLSVDMLEKIRIFTLMIIEVGHGDSAVITGQNKNIKYKFEFDIHF